MSRNLMKLLFLSTPVGPLGSGIGGGVELTLLNLAKVLQQRGHQITVVAPEGSEIESVDLVQISGNPQMMAQSQGRDAPIVLPPDSTLAKMWDYARQVQHNYDLIVNFAYDWLPLYLTPFFQTKIGHFISMGSLTEAMDNIIKSTLERFPKAVGFHTKAQAETFNFYQKNLIGLKSGINIAQYEFCSEPQNQLAWLGRIAPEKALEDAVAAAKITGIPLKIMGKMQDKSYWEKINQDYPDAPIEYLGFLSTNELQKHLGDCRALLMTPRWVEAFGNVAIEALACGVPVIAYRRGGPAEIVRDGETGWLVEPDSVRGLVNAIETLDKIDRLRCRKQAETEYSLEAWGDRVEKWLLEMMPS